MLGERVGSEGLGRTCRRHEELGLSPVQREAPSLPTWGTWPNCNLGDSL